MASSVALESRSPGTPRQDENRIHCAFALLSGCERQGIVQ